MVAFLALLNYVFATIGVVAVCFFLLFLILLWSGYDFKFAAGKDKGKDNGKAQTPKL